MSRQSVDMSYMPSFCHGCKKSMKTIDIIEGRINSCLFASLGEPAPHNCLVNMVKRNEEELDLSP